MAQVLAFNGLKFKKKIDFVLRYLVPSASICSAPSISHSSIANCCVDPHIDSGPVIWLSQVKSVPAFEGLEVLFRVIVDFVGVFI